MDLKVDGNGLVSIMVDPEFFATRHLANSVRGY